MNTQDFLNRLQTQPNHIEFADTMATIDNNYNYTPCSFKNGDIENPAGSNEGSCKLLAFAKIQGLSEEQTLACFGHYYRDDVLKNPKGRDHGNIRNFMATGWAGVSFANDCNQVLTAK